MRIINIGTYPPPFGGVSTHLQRLLEYLQERKLDSLLIDDSGQNKNSKGVVCWGSRKTKLFLATTQKSIVHIHNLKVGNLPLYFLLLLRHRMMVSFHNERFLDIINALGYLRKKAMLFVLNHCSAVVVDSYKCRALAEQLLNNTDHLVVIPEFIPPLSIPPLNCPALSALRNRHKFILSSNAWKISFYKNEDLYGIDMLVDLLHRLVNQRQIDVAIAFLLPNAGEEEYFNTIQERLASRGLGDRFLFITDPIEEASSLWKISDVVVRATNTDGNSMTVLEALSIGIPVVASDCTERPEGTLTFATRNTDDLEEKVTDILDKAASHRRRIDDIRYADNAASFVNLYERLSKK